MSDYMRVGFSLFKTFSFKLLLNPKIIKRYIHNDKIKKRKILIDKEEFSQSLSFVKNRVYGKTTFDVLRKYGINKNRVIQDYLYNHIDGGFLFYLIYKGYINVDQIDIDKICYVKWNFNDLKIELKEKEKEIDAVLYGMQKIL